MNRRCACLITAAVLICGEAQALTPDERNTIEVFERASESVVFITSKTLRRDFFTLNVYEIPSGSGSGFVWHQSGLIVTNFHVIHKASRLSVTLRDGSALEAKVVGVAPGKDLAVLSVDLDGQRLKALPLGDSSDLQTGRKALAIGNPFGLDASLTQGIISALGREIQSVNGRKIGNVIQTDAAINPGNSGGPLLNSRGEVIGVNTAIFSPTGANAGIGFAIPIDTAKRIIPQLIQYGRVYRPQIGITPAPRRWQSRLRVSGLLIAKVSPNSPAQRAGMIGMRYDRLGRVRPGDIIQKLDGKAIANYDDLLTALEERRAGETVTVITRRDGRQRRYRVRLDEPIIE